MKQSVLVLLVTAGVASADPDVLRLAPATPIDGLAPTTTETACNDQGGQLLGSDRAIGKAHVTALHDCGMDSMSVLAIHTPDDHWFASGGVTLTYYAGNMTEAPTEVSLIAERLLAGTLDDGSPAVIQAVSTREREVKRCLTDNPRCTPKVVSSQLTARVQVCSVTGTPACGTVSLTCPATGCTVPRLVRGTLFVEDRASGKRQLSVGRAPPPPPSRPRLP